MTVAFFLILALFFPKAAHAWDEADHQIITRLALEEVAPEWGLIEPCEVRPLQSFLNKIDGFKTKEAFSHFLKINPAIDLDHKEKSVLKRPTLSPLEILTFYSIDPDDGRDQDLPLISPDQKWFGVTKGPDTQAFRHIEKPPFNVKDPINTFGFPFRSVGEATRRAEIYEQLSLLAFDVGEPYWGWRFLAGAFHYLEDLHNPYHAGQMTPAFAARGLRAYFSWGAKEKGFFGTMSHLVSNSHRFFETLVSFPPAPLRDAKQSALEALRGREVLSLDQTVWEIGRGVRDSSNRQFGKLITLVTEVSDPILFTPYRFRSWEAERDDPARFLKKGAEKKEQEIFAIVQERFQSAGRVLRTVVQKSIQERRQRKSPKEILGKLEKLLDL